MGFLDAMDIGNRSLQLCGAPQILSPTEDTKVNFETTFTYDKLRRVELRRNNWRFATKKCVLRAVDTTTMVLQPLAYNSATVYLPGSIVVDTNNQLWYSSAENNVNNQPGGNNEIWEMYHGPMTIQPFDPTIAYWTGELVYMPGVFSGSYVIYQSLINVNSDVPNVATVYSLTVQYNGNSVVSYLGIQWSSLIEVNLGITPAVGPLSWSPTTAYTIGQTVTGSDHFIYSATGNTTGNDPTLDAGVHWTNTGLANAWQHSPAPAAASTNWRVIAATMKNLSFSYPIGSGPASQEGTENVFRLPAGYLRVAPQAPKAGSTSYLGAPSGVPYDDWVPEGNFIISSDTGPLLFRFIADVTKVSAMDDLFCEGLACRIATAICPSVTQSDGKLQTIASEYKTFMGDARTVNAIENGPIEAPEDDFVTCRI